MEVIKEIKMVYSFGVDVVGKINELLRQGWRLIYIGQESSGAGGYPLHSVVFVFGKYEKVGVVGQ
jgi:hypothetical protein